MGTPGAAKHRDLEQQLKDLRNEMRRMSRNAMRVRGTTLVTINPGPGVVVEDSDPINPSVGVALRAWNTDLTVAPTNNTAVVIALTYTPEPGTLHVRQNGRDLVPSQWSLVGKTLTISPATEVVIWAADVFSTAYWYDSSLIPEPSDPLPTYDTAVLDDFPALYLKLDETSGTAASDASGQGRHFTATNVTWNQGSLLANGAGSSIVLNGTTAYLARASEASMETSDFTCSFLYKHSSVVNRFPHIGRWLSGGQRPWLIGFDGTNLTVGINNFTDITYPWSPVNGQKYHIAVKNTFGTATLKLFIDGVVVATHNGSVITDSGAPFEIGRAAGTSYLPGQISRVAWWDSYLSDAQVALHAQAAVTP